MAAGVTEVAPVSFAAECPNWAGDTPQVLPETDKVTQHLSGKDGWTL
jgi:hypothetical protein